MTRVHVYVVNNYYAMPSSTSTKIILLWRIQTKDVVERKFLAIIGYIFGHYTNYAQPRGLIGQKDAIATTGHEWYRTTSSV